METYGEGSVRFDHRGTACKDRTKSKTHSACKGNWAGTVYLGGQRKTTSSTISKEDVWAKLKKFREEYEMYRDLDRSYTVDRCVKDWMASRHANLSRHTRDTISSLMRYFLPPIASEPLRTLTGKQVKAALKEYAQGRNDDTIQRVRMHLLNAIDYAISEDMLKGQSNVVKGVRCPPGTTEGRPSKSFPAEMRDAIYAKLDELDEPMMVAYILLCLHTAIRTEEARGLRWPNVDLDGMHPKSKGKPTVYIVESARESGGVKTPTSRRGIALSKKAAEALRLYRDWQAENGKYSETGHVFLDTRGKPMGQSSANYFFRKALRGIEGLNPKEWTCRETRHTFISLAALDGMPINQVAMIAGHKDIKTTYNVYTRYDLPVSGDAAELMDKT